MPAPNHIDLLLRLHPRGPFDLDEGSLYRADLDVAGWGLDLAWAQRDELLGELYPSAADDLLTSWERVYGVYRVAGRTIPQRQAAVLARVRLIPDFRPATIEEVLETLTGLDVTVAEPEGFRCEDADSLCDDDTSRVYGHLVFCVELDEVEARAEGAIRDELDELIAVMKPAHVLGWVCCDDFRTEDDWSLCDTDRLGG